MKLRLSHIPIYLFSLLLFTHPSFAQTDWAKGAIDQSEVIRQAATVTQAAFPNADEVVLDEYIYEAYQPDGSAILWDDEYIKVLTEKGKRGLQSRALHFTLSYGTAEYTKAEIIKPDGSIIPIDLKKQSKVMIDPSQMGSNIYNPNDQLFQITIPGLEINDILHLLSFRNTIKARAKNTWSSYDIFEYTSPIKHLIYEVKGPKSRPLKNIQLKDPVAKTVTYTTHQSQDHLHYRWEVKDVPRMFSEPQMPSLHTVVQRLLISTIEDWKDVSTWYWNLSEPHLNAVTEEMKKKTAALTADAKTDDDKIHALFQYVSKEIRYMGITPEKEAPGYEPHDVSLTFENRYGVCRDKAALLVAMLRIAELDAYPVLIMVGPKKDEDVPQPYFNHAIVGVRQKDGSYLLMDPTNENTKELLPAYLCNRSYLVAHPKGETLLVSPIIPADKNLVKINSHGKLTDLGTLMMQSTLLFEGINDSAYRGFFARQKPEERKKYCEGVIKDVVAGAKITALEILPANLQDMTEPLTINLTYEAPDYFIQGEDVIMIDPPILGARVGFINFVLGQTGLKTRKYPLATEIACGVEETFQIDLQNSAGEPLSLPTYKSIATPKTSFSMQLAMQDTLLTGKGSFQLKGVEYTPKEYQQLKQSLKTIETNFKKRPVFAKSTPAKQQDVRILEKKTTIQLTAAGSWRTVTRIKKKILTYAGKKSHSELKLQYNPVWTTLTLKKAIVKDRKGKTHHVVSDEINLMDAAWAGSAPRYPAAKTMVISLPGVEVGSVIDYEIESIQKDHPFFSLQKTFNGFDPIDQERFTLQVPASVPVTLNDHSGSQINYQKKGSNIITHIWKTKSQTALKAEDQLPPLWSFNPHVLVSTGNWKTFGQQLQTELEKASYQQMATVSKALELTKTMKTKREKVIAIRDYVAKQIRLAGPSLSQLPFSAISAADQTLEEGYGNTTDRAIVLYAMFQAIDLKPEFILASHSPLVPELRDPLIDLPSAGFFDHVLIRLTLKKQAIYLNDSDQYAHLGSTIFDQSLGLDLTGTIFTIHGLPETTEKSEDHYTISINASGDAQITWKQKYFGPAYAAFHRQFAELPPEKRKRYYQELVGGLSQNAQARGQLITAYETHPGERVFTADVKNFAVRSGRYLYFNLPHNLGSLFGLRAATRENPFYYASRENITTQYHIQFPGGTRHIKLAPKTVTLQAPESLGTIQYTSDWNAKKRLLEITRQINLEGAVIPVNQYDQLLKIQRTLDHPDTSMVMVEF